MTLNSALDTLQIGLNCILSQVKEVETEMVACSLTNQKKYTKLQIEIKQLLRDAAEHRRAIRLLQEKMKPEKPTEAALVSEERGADGTD